MRRGEQVIRGRRSTGSRPLQNGQRGMDDGTTSPSSPLHPHISQKDPRKYPQSRCTPVGGRSGGGRRVRGPRVRGSERKKRARCQWIRIRSKRTHKSVTSRAKVFSKRGKAWEGDAPAEPRGKMRLQRVFRRGRSLALLWREIPELKKRNRPAVTRRLDRPKTRDPKSSRSPARPIVHRR